MGGLLIDLLGNLGFGALEEWSKSKRPASLPLYLYNTLGKSKQIFTLPAQASAVRMYNCGPTVYDVQHIGNLSMFVFADTLRRALEYNNFSVKQVINITDVGHLTSDADEGEDKMTKGLRREGKELTLENMRELGERYTKIFLNDLQKLNIDISNITFPRASSYIPAQIALISTLVEKGYAYKTDDGVYFDTTRTKDYGVLGGINLGDGKNSRLGGKAAKRNLADFALWKFSSKSPNALGWDSPWGKGFPGWHTECSAMIRATLGERIDIHTGGLEHVAVHHNNEIVQSEAVTGKRPLARFWMHRAHVQFEGAKLAKSEGRVVYLSDITQKGFHPLALRYHFLGAHYRTTSNFTWNALEASQTAFLKLRQIVASTSETGAPPINYKNRIHERLNDDLDTPGALAALWEMTKDQNVTAADTRATILDADRVLGLNLGKEDKDADAAILRLFGKKVDFSDLPEDIAKSIKARAEARAAKNWDEADSIRSELAADGYVLEDTGSGTAVFKKE